MNSENFKQTRRQSFSPFFCPEAKKVRLNCFSARFVAAGLHEGGLRDSAFGSGIQSAGHIHDAWPQRVLLPRQIENSSQMPPAEAKT